MNKAIATFALVAAAALSASAADDATFAVRALSYNVRLKTSNDTGAKSWDSRKAALCDFVKDMDPDVIGFQEVDPPQMTDLKSLLPDYEIFGKHRTSDNKMRGTPVAYKKSRFSLLDGGTFWLSTTPDTPGSRGLPGGKTGTDPETCSWALLIDRNTRGVLCFFNTHLDYKQSDCRRLQMEIAVERTMRYANAGVPAVLVGDMNCYESTEGTIQAATNFLKYALYESATTPTGPWRTYNGWKWHDSSEEESCADVMSLPPTEQDGHRTDGGRCDYIFISRDIAVDAHATRNDSQPGKQQYPSDHFAILADLRVPCENDLFSGKVKVEIDKTVPYAGHGRYVLTHGANIVDDENLEFVLPEWVERAAVEDGEIVIYTKPEPLKIILR